MKLNIPKKKNHGSEVVNHSTNLNAEKTIKFARVKEVLGGYSNQEILEILVDAAIESYYDGKEPKAENLPKKLRDAINEYVPENEEEEEEDE